MKVNQNNEETDINRSRSASNGMSTLEYIAKKYNLDLSQPSPIEIPNVGRSDLTRWLYQLNFKVGVEVGVAAGRYSEKIATINPQLKLYGIDPWEEHKAYVSYNQNSLTTLYRRAQRRLNKYKNFQFVKAYSMDALANFKDESVDFVYIDANHQEPYVTQDITGWIKKLKLGGIIAGHDYIRLKRERCDVIGAVNNYTENNKVEPWFILGSNAKIPGTIRDNTRSWMWVKSR